MLQLCQPREVKFGVVTWWDDPDKYQRLYAYCAQDVVVERALAKRLMRLSPSEQALWKLDYKINQRGIMCDREAIKSAIAIVAIEKKRLDAEMWDITQGYVVSCSAVGRLKEWIKKQGIDVEGLAKNDVIELLASDVPHWVRRALELRQEAAKSSTAKLEAMLNRAAGDGRIRMTTQFHAAGTGRWGGRGIQPQNMPRPKISQSEINDVFNILREVCL